MIWLSILKNVRGIGPRIQLGLFLSAFLDVLLNIAGSASAFLPKVYFSGVVYLKPYGAYFYVRADSDDLYTIMPGREWDVNKIILNSLSKGDVFVDVGANVGYYSVLAAKIVGESGLVFSVEPVPSTANILNYNIELNHLKNVRVLQKAAWKRKEILTIKVPKGYYGLASLNESKGNCKICEVEGFPLDELGSMEIGLLKIDAEGSEYSILEGARKMLKHTRYVVLEVSYQEKEIIRLLKQENFMIQKLEFTTYLFAKKNSVK